MSSSVVGNHLTVISSFVAIVLLVALVGKRVGLHPVLAMLIIAIGVGLVNDAPSKTLISAISSGPGDAFSHFGFVIVLGAIFGKFLIESHIIQTISYTLHRIKHPVVIMFVMELIALIVGLPLFFEAGLIVIVPLILGVSRRFQDNARGYSALALILAPSFLVLLSMHALIPPHPGPSAVSKILEAPVYAVMGMGLLVAAPILLFVAPLSGHILSRVLKISAPNVDPHESHADDNSHSAATGSTSADAVSIPRSTWLRSLGAYLVLSLPVLFIFPGIVTNLLGTKTKDIPRLILLTSNPIIALLLSSIIAIIITARVKKKHIRELNEDTQQAVKMVASLVILLCAGGALSRTLQVIGISHAMYHIVYRWHIPLVLFAWLFAALLGTASGSATVAAMTTAQVISSSLAEQSTLHVILVVLAISAGSVFFGYTNHGSFWMMKDFFQLSIKETTIVATGLSTVLSVLSLIIIVLLGQIFV